MTPGSVTHASQYGPAELRAAAHEAHRLGLPVVGHAWGAQSIADAVAAGFDGVEHCGFFTPDGVCADPAVIEALAVNHVLVSSSGATTGPLTESVQDVEIRKRLPGIIAAYGRMAAAGVPIVMSSDAGVTPAKPHDVLPFGVQLLTHLGYPNAAALRAVTAWPATACGVGDRKGRVAVGYDADLLAVAGDPLHNVDMLHDVVAVFRGGVRVV